MDLIYFQRIGISRKRAEMDILIRILIESRYLEWGWDLIDVF